MQSMPGIRQKQIQKKLNLTPQKINMVVKTRKKNNIIL